MAENFPMPVKDITDSINPMDLKQDQLKKKKKKLPRHITDKL